MNKMAECLNAGIMEAAEAELLKETGYAASDSKGFRIPRNDLVKNDKFLVKNSTNTGTSKPSFEYSLTEEGIQYLQEQGKVADEPKSLEERQAMLLENLTKVCKAPADKIKAIWTLLLDGNEHTSQAALKTSGYKGTDSGGYKFIMKDMKEMKLLDDIVVKGKLKFSPKVLVFE